MMHVNEHTHCVFMLKSFCVDRRIERWRVSKREREMRAMKIHGAFDSKKEGKRMKRERSKFVQCVECTLQIGIRIARQVIRKVFYRFCIQSSQCFNLVLPHLS